MDVVAPYQSPGFALEVSELETEVSGAIMELPKSTFANMVKPVEVYSRSSLNDRSASCLLLPRWLSNPQEMVVIHAGSSMESSQRLATDC